MFPEFSTKIGLFGDPLLITEVVNAYIVIDQYCENMLMAGGQLGSQMPEHRRVIAMPAHRTGFVADYNERLAAEQLRPAMSLLDRFLD